HYSKRWHTGNGEEAIMFTWPFRIPPRQHLPVTTRHEPKPSFQQIPMLIPLVRYRSQDYHSGGKGHRVRRKRLSHFINRGNRFITNQSLTKTTMTFTRKSIDQCPLLFTKLGDKRLSRTAKETTTLVMWVTHHINDLPPQHHFSFPG